MGRTSTPSPSAVVEDAEAAGHDLGAEGSEAVGEALVVADHEDAVVGHHAGRRIVGEGVGLEAPVGSGRDPGLAAVAAVEDLAVAAGAAAGEQHHGAVREHQQVALLHGVGMRPAIGHGQVQQRPRRRPGAPVVVARRPQPPGAGGGGQAPVGQPRQVPLLHVPLRVAEDRPGLPGGAAVAGVQQGHHPAGLGSPRHRVAVDQHPQAAVRRLGERAGVLQPGQEGSARAPRLLPALAPVAAAEDGDLLGKGAVHAPQELHRVGGQAPGPVPAGLDQGPHVQGAVAVLEEGARGVGVGHVGQHPGARPGGAVVAAAGPQDASARGRLPGAAALEGGVHVLGVIRRQLRPRVDPRGVPVPGAEGDEQGAVPQSADARPAAEPPEAGEGVRRVDRGGDDDLAESGCHGISSDTVPGGSRRRRRGRGRRVGPGR